MAAGRWAHQTIRALLMSTRLRVALSNRLGAVLLGTGIVGAAIIWLAPGLKAPTWLPLASLLLGLVAYGLTSAIYYWTPDSIESPAQVQALRRLRVCIAEQVQLHAQSQALRPILSEALERLDGETLPSIERLLQRHGLLRRDLQRFQTGEILAPDPERIVQLTTLYERQERAVENIGRQVANAYASLIVLTQQVDDDASLATDAKDWSNQLFETQENLANLLDEAAAFDRALEARSKRGRAG